MAGAPVPDRPDIHSNASPWLKGPRGHVNVLIRTMRGEAWTSALDPGSYRLDEVPVRGR
jgi:hypothetical protein